MIVVEDVYKRYQTDHGPSKWVLQGVSFTIPPKTNVGLIGKNGAGKSTLLRIIGGVDQPTRGKVERRCRVSWPMGFGGGLQGSLTGRQNAKFICRIHGHESDIPDRLARIQDFAELGDAFDEPVKTYSSGMKSRLQFALSLAFDFDVYISDEVTATGDATFRTKAAAAFKDLADRAGLIMVSHGEGVLKQFCTAGIWLHEGRAQWFDKIDDALEAYRASEATRAGSQAAGGVSNKMRPAGVGGRQASKTIAAKLRRFQSAFRILERGFKGHPLTVEHEEGRQLAHQAFQIGILLLPLVEITQRGYGLRRNTVPALRRYTPDGQECVDLYDINSQCVKVEETQ